MADLNPVINFWLDVQRELETTFGMSSNQAREALDGYRRRMASHDALDVVYNSEPQYIAQAIRGGRFAMDPPRCQ
ncbi:MAG: hypothetical protein ACHQ50_16490 [Fimbriimonadales bacterium]